VICLNPHGITNERAERRRAIYVSLSAMCFLCVYAVTISCRVGEPGSGVRKPTDPDSQ